MSEASRGGSTFIGIIVGIVALIVTINLGNESSDEHQRIDQVVSTIRDTAADTAALLSKLEITIGGANAHALSTKENMDFPKYLQTPIAKTDVQEISRIVKSLSSEREKALEMISQQLIQISNDYKAQHREMPTSPRERKVVEGLTMSHRRQMGVLISAIRESEATEAYLTLANSIEKMLHATM